MKAKRIISIENRAILDVIQEEVLSFYHLEPEEVFSDKRFYHLLTARQTYHYLAKLITDLSFAEIGYSTVKYKLFDHATVLNSSKKISNAIHLYKNERQNLETIKERVQLRIGDPTLFMLKNSLTRDIKRSESIHGIIQILEAKSIELKEILEK